MRVLPWAGAGRCLSHFTIVRPEHFSVYPTRIKALCSDSATSSAGFSSPPSPPVSPELSRLQRLRQLQGGAYSTPMQSSTGLYTFADREDILVGGGEVRTPAGRQSDWFASEASTPEVWGSVVGTPAGESSSSVLDTPVPSVGRRDPPPATPLEMAQVADKVGSLVLSPADLLLAAAPEPNWYPCAVVQDVQDSQGELILPGVPRGGTLTRSRQGSL